MRVQVRALPAAHTRRHTTCCGRAPYNMSTAPNARGMQCGAGARLTDESVRCVEMLSSLTSLSIDHSRVDFPEGLTSKVCVRASVRASGCACGCACVCVCPCAVTVACAVSRRLLPGGNRNLRARHSPTPIQCAAALAELIVHAPSRSGCGCGCGRASSSCIACHSLSCISAL